MFEYNKNYTVIGELTVDDTYNCINCTFNMSENSSIVVEGGSAFNLGNSSIQSLDGTQWNRNLAIYPMPLAQMAIS